MEGMIIIVYTIQCKWYTHHRIYLNEKKYHWRYDAEDDAKNNDKEHCSGMDADTKDIRDLNVD